MLTFRKWINSLTGRDESGFSLLELVVAVGIVLVLAVGGFIAYQGITQNSRVAAVESAAEETYIAALAAEASDGSWSSIEKVQDDWNGSQTQTEVEISRDASNRLCVSASYIGNDDVPDAYRGIGGACGENGENAGNGGNDGENSGDEADRVYAPFVSGWTSRDFVFVPPMGMSMGSSINLMYSGVGAVPAEYVVIHDDTGADVREVPWLSTYFTITNIDDTTNVEILIPVGNAVAAGVYRIHSADSEGNLSADYAEFYLDAEGTIIQVSDA